MGKWRFYTTACLLSSSGHLTQPRALWPLIDSDPWTSKRSSLSLLLVVYIFQIQTTLFIMILNKFINSLNGKWDRLFQICLHIILRLWNATQIYGYHRSLKVLESRNACRHSALGCRAGRRESKHIPIVFAITMWEMTAAGRDGRRQDVICPCHKTMFWEQAKSGG